MVARKLPDEVTVALGELKEELSRLYGERLRGIYLFGSYARGEYRPESDVDILIVLQGPVKAGEEIRRYGGVISDICIRHDLLISTLPVAEETFRDGPRSFFEPVKREAVPL